MCCKCRCLQKAVVCVLKAPRGIIAADGGNCVTVSVVTVSVTSSFGLSAIASFGAITLVELGWMAVTLGGVFSLVDVPRVLRFSRGPVAPPAGAELLTQVGEGRPQAAVQMVTRPSRPLQQKMFPRFELTARNFSWCHNF